MEETMRELTITELMRLTRTELCALLAPITNELPAFPEGSVERRKRLRQHRQCPPRAFQNDVAAQIARHERGEALQNVVDRRLGY
jgi:hypothetical protein